MPRNALVTEMIRNVAVARFVVSALPKAVKNRTAHRALVAFHTAALFEYISRVNAPDDGIMAFLLPAMLEPLQHNAAQAGTKDVVVNAPFHSFLSQGCSGLLSCLVMSSSPRYHKKLCCKAMLSKSFSVGWRPARRKSLRSSS